jgi:hypothetical protein
MKYQSRYIAYAKSNNNTPEKQLEIDAHKYPGGKMSGFIVWISDIRSEWSMKTNEIPKHGWSKEQHKKFDQWLNSKFHI